MTDLIANIYLELYVLFDRLAFYFKRKTQKIVDKYGLWQSDELTEEEIQEIQRRFDSITEQAMKAYMSSMGGTRSFYVAPENFEAVKAQLLKEERYEELAQLIKQEEDERQA
tara:strand:- start:237 stop:572 length:336 start_codon:yes stop_codon:yes gene_type:complete